MEWYCRCNHHVRCHTGLRMHCTHCDCREWVGMTAREAAKIDG